MSDRPWPMALAVLGIVAVVGPGCGLVDVFAAPGLAGGVTFTFVGDTALDVGDRVPFSVVVRTEKGAVAGPPLLLAVADSTIAALTPSRDSIVGCKAGQTALLVRLQVSILAGPEPTFAQIVKVSGGPALPTCP